MKNTIRVGDLISTRHGTSKIKKIELCEKPGEKYGIPVKRVFTNLLDRVIIDLENGHWTYGSDAEVINERVS